MTKSGYTLTVVVNNLEIGNHPIAFPGENITLLLLGHGRESAEWREKLRCRNVPRHILVLKGSYSSSAEDPTGYAHKIADVEQFLLLLRLFRTGDLNFAESMTIDDSGNWLGAFSLGYRSLSKYQLDTPAVRGFLAFAKRIKAAASFSSDHVQLACKYFSRGVDTEFNIEWSLSRIIDYAIALECLLVGNEEKIRSTLAHRGAKLLGEKAEKGQTHKLLFRLYDMRSGLVHNGKLSEKHVAILRKGGMGDFESVVRSIITRFVQVGPTESKNLQKFREALYPSQKGGCCKA